VRRGRRVRARRAEARRTLPKTAREAFPGEISAEHCPHKAAKPFPEIPAEPCPYKAREAFPKNFSSKPFPNKSLKSKAFQGRGGATERGEESPTRAAHRGLRAERSLLRRGSGVCSDEGAEFAPTREQSLLRRGSERAFTLAWKRAIRSPRRRVIAPLSPLRSAAPGPCCGSP